MYPANTTLTQQQRQIMSMLAQAQLMAEFSTDPSLTKSVPENNEEFIIEKKTPWYDTPEAKLQDFLERNEFGNYRWKNTPHYKRCQKAGMPFGDSEDEDYEEYYYTTLF